MHNIPHAYVSRVSNDTVFKRAKAQRPTLVLSQRQEKLYERIAKMGPESFLRQILTEKDDVTPRGLHCQRKRGRPRLQWSTATFATVLAKAGGDVRSLRRLFQ